MTIPYRGHTGQGTYFITASTYLKQNLLQTERMARLFLDVLQHYWTQEKYLLHEFVIMKFGKRAFMTAECGMGRNMSGSGGTSTRIPYSEAWRDAHRNTRIALQIRVLFWTKYLSG